MTLKYDDNVNKKHILFTISTNGKITKTLSPLFLTNNGFLYYSGNDHVSSDIIGYTNHELKQLLCDIFPNTNYRKERPQTKLKTISGITIRNYFNFNPNEIPYSKVIYYEGTNDAIMLCNSIIDTKNQVNNFSNKLNHNHQTLINLANLLKISTSHLTDQVQEYIPFTDNITHDEELFKYHAIINSSQLIMDYLVQYVTLHKIETMIPRTITTSTSNIYETFFNYMIMGFTITQIPKIVYDQETNSFSYKQHSFYQTSQEKEFETEIETIKKLVPPEDRHKYLI